MGKRLSQNKTGLTVRKLRGQIGLSVCTLASKAGINPMTLYRLEDGQDVTLGVLAKVAGALGCSIELIARTKRSSRKTVPA